MIRVSESQKTGNSYLTMYDMAYNNFEPDVLFRLRNTDEIIQNKHNLPCRIPGATEWLRDPAARWPDPRPSTDWPPALWPPAERPRARLSFPGLDEAVAGVPSLHAAGGADGSAD